MDPRRRLCDPDWFHGRTGKGRLPISFTHTVMSQVMPILHSYILRACRPES